MERLIERKEFKVLLEAHKSGSFPHAVLIESAESLWESLYYELSALLLCSKKGCGSCDVCRLIKAERHPDIFLVKPVGKNIRIQECRYIKNHLYLDPVVADKKIAFFWGGEKFSIPAANSLLKLIEEPPKDAFLFIFTESLQQILPTIKSRCWIIRLPLLDENIAEKEIISFNYKDLTAEHILHISSKPRDYLLNILKQLEKDDINLSYIRSLAERTNLSSAMIFDLVFMVLNEGVDVVALYNKMGQT